VIRVVCTGKGTHREYRFVRIAFEFDPSWAAQFDPEWRGEGVPGEWQELGFRPLQRDYTFSCPRCGRKIRQMKANTLRKALDGLHAKGSETLDISSLPF
jgi:hypothetical protein